MNELVERQTSKHGYKQRDRRIQRVVCFQSNESLRILFHPHVILLLLPCTGDDLLIHLHSASRFHGVNRDILLTTNCTNDTGWSSLRQGLLCTSSKQLWSEYRFHRPRLQIYYLKEYFQIFRTRLIASEPKFIGIRRRLFTNKLLKFHDTLYFLGRHFWDQCGKTE